MMIPAAECKEDILKYRRMTSVEFIIGTKCQNACKYCYRVAHQNEGEILGTTIDRMRLAYENAIDMGLIDRGTDFELFGGDPIVDYDFVHDTLLHFRDDARSFCLPSNGRVVENIKDQEIDALIAASGNKMHISLSVDGPQDVNRPLSQYGQMMNLPEERNWDRLFYLAKKYHWGFHPMLYFPTAHLWYDTWKWFYDRHGSVYLLEVRHPIDDINLIYEGVYQLAKIILECEKHGVVPRFNTTMPSRVPRGLGCSALTTLTINTDGKLYFCHRLLQRKYLIADLITKTINMRKFVMLGAGYDFRNSTTCMHCPIKHYCCRVCTGAMDEYWQGATSLPIPSVCKYELLKILYLTHRTTAWDGITQSIDTNQLKRCATNAFPDLDNVIKIMDGRLKSDGLL